MDYEREKGRIRGHTTTRSKSIDFAKKMIPLLAIARLELPNYGGGSPSKRALANWLNMNGHLSQRNRNWRSETISRLLNVHLLGMAEIEKEHEIAKGMRSYMLRNKNYPMREQRLAELTEMDAKREQTVIEMKNLAAALRGQFYVGMPISQPLVLTNKGAANIIKAIPEDENDEIQLSLFPEIP